VSGQGVRPLFFSGKRERESSDPTSIILLAAEVFYILREQTEYDPLRYARMLKRLPELPQDTDA
jgi:hypothetical protein